MRQTSMSRPVTLASAAERPIVLLERRTCRLRKVALVVVAVGLASTVATASQNPQVVLGRVQIGLAGVTSPPEVKCVDGQPADSTQFPFLPCTGETTRVIGRSEVQVGRIPG